MSRRKFDARNAKDDSDDVEALQHCTEARDGDSVRARARSRSAKR
jgi:hypothetical protein